MSEKDWQMLFATAFVQCGSIKQMPISYQNRGATRREGTIHKILVRFNQLFHSLLYFIN